jgi:hypothetical protein
LLHHRRQAIGHFGRLQGRGSTFNPAITAGKCC